MTGKTEREECRDQKGSRREVGLKGNLLEKGVEGVE